MSIEAPTLAETAIKACAGSLAGTLAGGYAVWPFGERRLFKPGRVLKERTDDVGRCTYLLVEFEDGSKAEYRSNCTPFYRVTA